MNGTTNRCRFDQRNNLLDGLDAVLRRAQDLNYTVSTLRGHVREDFNAGSDFLELNRGTERRRFVN